MSYQIVKKDKKIAGEINLTTSKSISNRLLLIQALKNDKVKINKLSDSEDTKLMKNGLNPDSSVIDAGHAGTAMRFLTSFYAQKEGEWTLTGTERMKQRPISILVDGLKQLGADITYLEEEGFPPLKIKGKKLSGNYVKIDGSVSSQYITSILLISPVLENGLKLELVNKISSVPYIKLTLELMKYFGIEYSWNDNIIEIKPGGYINNEYTVEADWSGASYWYEMAMFAEEVDLKIYGLSNFSLQGDSIVATIFELFGIQTKYIDDGVHLINMGRAVRMFTFDFSNFPDLVQTIVPTCVLNRIPFKITGAESLKIKETDRIKALQDELLKFGARIKETSDGVIEWDGSLEEVDISGIEIETYVDHRMAMAFAPIAISCGNIIIKNPMVVNKSYPNFWNDLKQFGFEINDI